MENNNPRTEQHRIHVACLAAYNNGILHGAWIESTEARSMWEATRDMLTKSPTSRFKWEGIEIEATYVPRSWGGAIAHLESERIPPPRAPPPITETGYKSHYHPCGTVEANGGDLVAQIIAWLDEEATKPKWRAYVAKSRQGELF